MDANHSVSPLGDAARGVRAGGFSGSSPKSDFPTLGYLTESILPCLRTALVSGALLQAPAKVRGPWPNSPAKKGPIKGLMAVWSPSGSAR
eukprot:5485061-Pyramimonas_sp.AAC.1